MKKITTTFVIFLLLSTLLLNLSVTTVISNNEKQIVENQPMTRFLQHLYDRFKNLREKFSTPNHMALGSDDFSPEDVEIKDDAFHESDSLHFLYSFL